MENPQHLFPTRCTINLSAIAKNIRTLRAYLPSNTRIMPIVKANGYGTNAFSIVQFLAQAGIDIFGVSFVHEALDLRKKGINTALFVIHATPDQASEIVDHHLEIGISEPTMLRALTEAATRSSERLAVHLQVNTGMGRFGCSEKETLSLAHKIAATPALKLEGLMTHLACAEDPTSDAFTQLQYQRLTQAHTLLTEHGHIIPYVHAANSAGILRHDFPLCNLARPGLAILGLHSNVKAFENTPLTPAITLTTRVTAINLLKAGDTVSYCRNYRAKKEGEKCAVLPLGYSDGIHRRYSGKNHVLIKGHQAPIIGNICMDYLMVDITNIPGVAIGDEVLIFGQDQHGHKLPIEDFAETGGSIAHELLACLGPRVSRLFI